MTMITEKREIVFPDGTTLEYILDRGDRKNVYIVVKNGTVILKLPSYADIRHGERCLRRKQAWLLEKLTERPQCFIHPEHFTDQTLFTLVGKEFTVRCIRSDEYEKPTLINGSLLISAPLRDGRSAKDLSAYIDTQARRGIITFAVQYIKQRAEELTELTGLHPAKITVKKLTASWGRCNSAGNISLNVDMIYYPPECIDYVIIHELCHLRYMDHSREFWALVAQYCPDWKEIRGKMR